MYYGARYYDPWVGRFLSQDPALIGSVAGPSFGAISSDPQEFNAYSYARNTPTRYTDPTGAAIVQHHNTRSGYIIHYSGASAIKAGITHVGGTPIGGNSGGSTGGNGGRKSAGEMAIGASFSEPPTTETISVPEIEIEGGEVARINEQAVVGPVYVSIRAGKEGANIKVNAKESNLIAGDNKMPVSMEVGENQIRGPLTMDAGQAGTLVINEVTGPRHVGVAVGVHSGSVFVGFEFTRMLPPSLPELRNELQARAR